MECGEASAPGTGDIQAFFLSFANVIISNNSL